MKTGIELIAAERQEQIEKHHWDAEHDQQHENGELITAAKYALEPCQQNFRELPLGWSWFVGKIDKKSEIERLKIAGALIAAEIDRLNNL